MRLEILGHERRRRWRAEEKLAIVNSVGVDGATVTEVALRHDVSRQQIYMWRSELKPHQNAPYPPVNSGSCSASPGSIVCAVSAPLILGLRLKY